MKSIPLAELKPGTFFSDNVYAARKYIVLCPELAVTTGLLKLLKRWEFNEVYTNGTRLSPDKNKAAAIDTAFDGLDPEEFLGEKDIDVIRLYFDFMQYSAAFFSGLTADSDIKTAKVKNLVMSAIKYIDVNINAFFKVTEYDYPVDNYLYTHAVNSVFRALALAKGLGLGRREMLPLGVSAFFHDVGMALIPKRIYLSRGAISIMDRDYIRKHALMGYDLLKNSGISEAVSCPALEHHERLDGSGYPYGIESSVSHINSRIIAVSCSFDAAVSDRPYKECLDPHAAIMDIIHKADSKYDSDVVAVLKKLLSLYPVGSFVQLSDGRTAIVAKANSDYPAMPVVKVLFDREHKALEHTEIVQIYEDGELSIARQLKKDELFGSLKQK